MALQKDPWPAYEPPRNVDNLDVPWGPSLDRDGSRGHDIVYPIARPLAGYPGNLGWAIRTLRRLLARIRDRPRHTDIMKPKDFPHIPLSEWRAFAAYSRPTVNGVNVHNTFTPSPTPYRNIDLDELDDLDLDEVFASLRSPSGTLHPERWIRGLQHPSLPPPPTGWPLPRPGEPLTFPWDCQVNPFLEHAVCGPAPVYWNIRTGELAILYGGPLNISIPLSAPDLAQPATHPLLTHMYVNGLALTDASFPWKFMVVNPAGIRVRDVFKAVSDNFLHFVFRKEYERWPKTRQRHAELEWALRGGAETQDGLRRMDYLGGQLFFRGLAPNPDRSGWVLFLGREW